MLPSVLLLAFSSGMSDALVNHDIAPEIQNSKGAGRLRTTPFFRPVPICDSARLYMSC